MQLKTVIVEAVSKHVFMPRLDTRARTAEVKVWTYEAIAKSIKICH